MVQPSGARVTVAKAVSESGDSGSQWWMGSNIENPQPPALEGKNYKLETLHWLALKRA